MEKKWRSILTLALDETEVPGDDDEGNSPRTNRMMRRRGPTVVTPNQLLIGCRKMTRYQQILVILMRLD